MKCDFRSECPITSALDVIGDKWSLVIIRDMILMHKKTFKDFSASNEKIATNILSSRLKNLEQIGIITKEKLPDNKKVNIYKLTEKGIGILPVILELALWSHDNIGEFHTEMQNNPEFITRLKTDKEGLIQEIQERYRTANFDREVVS